MTMLNNIELATLANKLQVPMVVSDILNEDGALSDDVKYGLHELISEMQPDSALLAIAISALKVAQIYKNASPSMDVMSIEANRIIDEYGYVWLKNANNQEINSAEIYELLIHTAEDLENIAELLDLNCSFLRAKDSDAARLCDILYIQAKSHALIAEEFISATDQMVVNGDVPVLHAHTPVFTDNVIAFPAGR